jgi:hypothetical protein
MRGHVLVLCAAFIVATSVTGARAHCQIPCGIYGDDLRFAMIAEDLQTIEKSMTMIVELSADPGANANPLTRWVMNKEHHADLLSEIITQYFMAQRLKLPDESDAKAVATYRDQLAMLHKMLVYAMKCKQTTDLANIAVLHDTAHAFQEAYQAK